jgi:tetratricopeptide (TPR) repeat protein
MNGLPSLLRRAVAILVLSLLTGISGAVLAVGQGRIVGRVTDGNGAPLEGVKVTITTPALTNFKFELKTDKNGKWGTILNDATLTYNYKFEKEGYVPVQQMKKVPIGSTESLDIQLLTQNQAVEKGVVKQVVDPFTAAYNDAVDKFQSGDLDAALAKALEATKLQPERANGFDLAAKIAGKKKDWDQAIPLAEKSLALEADNSSLFGLLAEGYRAKGDKAKAAEWEKKYVAANPDQPDVLYNQAVELYNKNDFKGAEPLLLKVLAAKPDHAQAHFLIGMCDVNLNKIAEMKAHLAKYLELDPKGKDASTAKEMLDAFK